MADEFDIKDEPRESQEDGGEEEVSKPPTNGRSGNNHLRDPADPFQVISF